MAEIFSIDDLRRAAQARPAEIERSWADVLTKARRLHGRMAFRGLDISIENRAGSVRHWTDHTGKKGQTKLTLPYGYIRGTVGADGEHLDCFVGPNQNAPNVYVIDTAKKPDFTEFDEHKCFLGFNSAAEARAAFVANYDEPRILMGMVEIPFARFTEWMTSRKHTTAPAATGPRLVAKAEILASIDASTRLFQPEPGVTYADLAKAHAGAGPFIGPRGGKWADPQHTVAWRPPAPSTESKAPVYPIADPPQYGHTDYKKTGGKIQMMAPAEYLRIAPPLARDEETEESVGIFAEHMKSGRTIDPPMLAYDDAGKLTHHDGRHRALAAQKLGMESIPVLTFGSLAPTKAQTAVESVVKQSEIDSLGIPREAMPQIIVSSDNRVLDGHHRWAHGLAHSPDTKLNAIRIDLPIHRLIEEARGFAKVEFRATAKSMSIQSDVLTAPFRGENAVRTTQTAEEKGTDKDSQKQQLRDSGFSHEDVKDLVGKLERIPGGLARGKKPADFDASALRHGIEVEMEHTTDRAIAREIAMDHLIEDPHYYRKLATIEKSNQIQQPNRIGAPMFTIQSGTLQSLQKGAIIAHPPGGGWGPIPRGMHGGFRKRHGSGWVYWYPQTGRLSGAQKPAAEWDETHFLANQFDTDPSRWHFVRAVAGQTAIVGWTQGGIDPRSAHPVKIAGQEHKLYRITKPEHTPGWAELVNVNDASDTHTVRHERVYPVEYGIHVPKLVVRPAAPAWEPGAPTKGRPTAVPPVGPVAGSEKRLPPYGASTAKHGSYLAKVESGHYPSRDVRRYEPDADGTPRIIRARTLYMLDMDKLGLLTEFAPLIRKIARNTSRTFGLAHDAIPDLNSAAMEGMLVAIDSYPGGTSFGRHAGSIATDYARLHAAREFAGGIAMPRRHARLLRTFIAAKAEAARTHETGTPSVEEVAKLWRIRKRDVHPGLDKDAGRDELIPMQNYGLRGAQFAPGNENAGRIALAERYLQFLEGQHKGQGAAFFDDDAAIFRATEATGGGLAPHEKEFIRHAVSEALEQLRNHRVTIGRREWRSDAAQLIRRRLGLDTDAEQPLTIARHVPVYWLDRKGEWRQVSPRRASDVIDAIVSDGLNVAKQALGGEAAGAVTRAQEAVLPAAPPTGGPTAGERFRALAHAVTREEVRTWRQGERERLRKLVARYRSEGDSDMASRAEGRMRYLNGIGLHRARAIIAQRKLFSTPRALSWFRTAIPLPIEPEAPAGQRYTAGTMTVTDPSTGKQRSLRVSRLTDLAAPAAPSAVRKSEAQVESDTHETTADEAIAVRMHAAFPNLARLLFASHDGVVDAPGRERDSLLELMGYA